MKPPTYKPNNVDHKDRLALGISLNSINAFHKKQDRQMLNEHVIQLKKDEDQNTRMRHLQENGHESVTYNYPAVEPPKGRQNYRIWRQRNSIHYQVTLPRKYYSLPPRLRDGYL